MINLMDKENIYGEMEINILEIGFKIIDKVLEVFLSN